MKKLIVLGCISLLMLSCNGNEQHMKFEDTRVNEDMNSRIIKLMSPSQDEIDNCIENYTRKGYKIKSICSAGMSSTTRLYIHIEKGGE